MKSFRLKLWAILAAMIALVAVRVGLANPSPGDKDQLAAADAQILSEIREHSEAMQNLEFISDNIGQRLTGSTQLMRANAWTRDQFIKYGLTNAHLEPWTIERSWTRGTAQARIVSPAEHPLTIASAGWSPNTPGLIKGPIVYFDAKTKEDFQKFHEKLRGAIIITREPAAIRPPRSEDPAAELTEPMQEPPPRIGEARQPDPDEAVLEQQKGRFAFWKQEGVAAVLADSEKPYGLLNMTDVSLERYGVGAIPAAFITGEGYRMLFRMQKHGPVQVEIEITNTIGSKPVEVYNTIAEIRGSEKPDEMVILGAHLDSWDLGTGSTDNGTGSAAVLEAARALAKLDLKPKRTIRFVLFTGEEQGLYGSQEYVKTHQNELEKISAVLVHDAGTGRVLKLGLHDNYQDRELVDQVLAPGPLHDLKLLEPSMARSFGTDHLSFDEVGIPGFYCIQDRAEYGLTHHSQSDTFDKASKDDLNQGAEVLAAWAYNIAQLPALLPRRPLPYNPAPNATHASEPKKDTVAEMDTKILQQVKSDEQELKANLSYLADRIGPRLTGSPQLDQASHWTLERFKEIGFANAHLEPWKIDTGWTRGTAIGRIISPAQQQLSLAAYGWSPNTNGTIRGNVIGIDALNSEDLGKYKGKLKGAIVLMGAAYDLNPPANPMATPYDQMSLPIATPRVPGLIANYEKFGKTRRAEMKMIEEEGAAAVLFPADKWYGLFAVTRTGTEAYKIGKVPTAGITRENLMLLWRLLANGPVQAEVNIENTINKQPPEVYNTVAEIRGTEKPDEVVIIGGHLDSWDLATGATDNGTGSMAVLEAARALQKLGVKPKRTIRFVLFTGEEQGLNGSRAYVKAHKDELAKISGVLVDDSGTGKVLTLGLMANYGVRETMDRVLYPLAEAKDVGLSEPSLRVETGSDHIPFDEAGVPAFWCIQDNVDYDRTHHSQADTLDRVRWDDLTEGAQVLAVFAYNVAQLPEMLPRKPTKKKAD
ncbi:MAG TPA: M20/M25/M40 family metallo-hydrolase [Candidatus Acidoferrum sp.]